MSSRKIFIAVLALAAVLAVNGPCTAEAADESAGELMTSLRQAADQDDHAEVRQLATRLLALDPDATYAWYLRGRANFCLGEFDESLADFDELIRRQPESKVRLWERGITCYYVGKYSDGAEQFALYQRYDSRDVENSVWRYLCQARQLGHERARREMLPIEGDPRVPMMEVFRLFRGELAPDDVMKAAERPAASDELAKRQMFYAHLYLGLYLDSHGQTDEAREHLEKAVRDFPHRHYMHDVARLHAELLAKKSDEPG